MVEKISLRELIRKSKEFDKLEERSSFYSLALNLLEKGFEIEAYILILATWNFAGFRYMLKKFDLNKFKKVIEKINPIFEKLKNEKFETVDFNKIEGDIEKIYVNLKEIAGQTGASKIMHLKIPSLFIMWDTKIRKAYKISNKGEPKDYIKFLKKMQALCRDIKWIDKNKTLAKAIDEYNYIKYTLSNR